MNTDALEKLSHRGIQVKKSSRIPNYSNPRGQVIKSHGPTCGNTALPAKKEYTGDAIIGIATLHKSNAVPVFSQQEAEDISKMRR